MQHALEPVELGAVGEHDPADRGTVDLAVGVEDPVAPSLAQLRLEALVLAVDAVHELVRRGDGGAAARERRKRLSLSGRDTPGDRDRERPPRHYSGAGSSTQPRPRRSGLVGGSRGGLFNGRRLGGRSVSASHVGLDRAPKDRRR